jgi:hypothetical protein
MCVDRSDHAEYSTYQCTNTVRYSKRRKRFGQTSSDVASIEVRAHRSTVFNAKSHPINICRSLEAVDDTNTARRVAGPQRPPGMSHLAAPPPGGTPSGTATLIVFFCATFSGKCSS